MSCSGISAGGFGEQDGHAMTVIRRSQPTLPPGAEGSCLTDHTEGVTSQLYSGCTARQGQDNRTLHKLRDTIQITPTNNLSLPSLSNNLP